MSRLINPLTGFCLSILLFLQSASLIAAPSADLWERWTKHNPASAQSIRHDEWGELLNRYLTVNKRGVNRFNYSAVTTADHARLKNYLATLSDTAISAFNRHQQLAYWINFYNALTVSTILDYYPLQSIRDISGGLFSSGPWNMKLVTVEAEKLSLNDIEHRILRPIWQDPRIHYAVNCASYGCPNLQARAFGADQNELLLSLAAREFINHERAVDISKGKLRVSSIYKWYQSDFGGSETSVIQHLRQYAEPDLKSSLAGITKIADYHYDWSLNDTITK